MYFNSFQPNNSFLQGYFNNPVNFGATPFRSYGYFGGGTPSVSSSSSSVDTPEKRQEKLDKIEKQIKEKKEAIATVDELVKRADKAKLNEDGTYTEKESFTEYKKQPWWKKTLRAAGNMVAGTFKMIEGFAGIEKDPETEKTKFKPLKLLKNVAIAGALVGLTCIPVVGPFISFGLLAAGVVTGVGGMTKGIIKATKAESTEELDNAFQDIGQGAAIGVSSAFGLRGLGKGLSVANEMNAAKGLTTFTQSTSKTGIGQAFLDMTVNAFKATKAASVSSKAAALEAGGFWKGWGNNLKAKLPKFGKKAAESKLAETNKNINDRLSKIEAELDNTVSGSEKEQLLTKEFDMLMNQKQELANASTSADWRKLNPEAKLGKKVSGSSESYRTYSSLKKIKIGSKVNIGGDDIMVTKDNIEAIRSLAARAEWISNDVTAISKLNQPFYSRLSGIYAPDKGMKKSKQIWHWTKSAFSSAFRNLIGITWKPYQLISKSPAATWYNFESTFIVPAYTTSMVASMLGAGNKQMTDILPDENGQAAALNSDKVKAYKNELEKIKSEINKLQQEQYDLMMA